MTETVRLSTIGVELVILEGALENSATALRLKRQRAESARRAYEAAFDELEEAERAFRAEVDRLGRLKAQVVAYPGPYRVLGS